MYPESLQTRNDAYRWILTWGLLAIRKSAILGQTKLCEIEADHIHNLPSLIDELNIHRHHYYITSERDSYLDRLKQLGQTEYLQNQQQRYQEAWELLSDPARRER